VIVTRPDQGVEKRSSTGSDKPAWFRKQGATLASFILCYQKIFVPKALSLKFMHIYTDQGNIG